MRVKISELKARLTHYLRLVKSGERITVCDRATPIAELKAFEGDAALIECIPAEKPLSDALSLLSSIKARKPSKLSSVRALLSDRGRRF